MSQFTVSCYCYMQYQRGCHPHPEQPTAVTVNVFQPISLGATLSLFCTLSPTWPNFHRVWSVHAHLVFFFHFTKHYSPKKERRLCAGAQIVVVMQKGWSVLYEWVIGLEVIYQRITESLWCHGNKMLSHMDSPDVLDHLFYLSDKRGHWKSLAEFACCFVTTDSMIHNISNPYWLTIIKSQISGFCAAWSMDPSNISHD